jgi:hypothetical protein
MSKRLSQRKVKSDFVRSSNQLQTRQPEAAAFNHLPCPAVRNSERLPCQRVQTKVVSWIGAHSLAHFAHAVRVCFNLSLLCMPEDRSLGGWWAI